MSPAIYPWICLATLVLGWWLLIFFSPLKPALLDGIRILAKFPVLFTLPLACSLIYTLFQVLILLIKSTIIPDFFRENFLDFHFSFPHPPELFLAALQPMLEATSSLYAFITPVFPASSILALLYLFNFKKSQTKTRQGLRKHFPRAFWILYPLSLITALAALFKPSFFLLLLHPTLSFSSIQFNSFIFISHFSELFEFILGTGIQIAMLIIAFIWISGASRTSKEIFSFALKRLPSVLKWAMCQLSAVIVFILIPLLLPLFFEKTFPVAPLHFIQKFSIPFLAGVTLLFPFMHYLLIFHNLSLREAFKQNFHFLRTDLPTYLQFLFLLVVHLLIAFSSLAIVQIGCPPDSLFLHLASIPFQILSLFFLVWFLATWVSLCKQISSHPGKPLKSAAF